MKYFPTRPFIFAIAILPFFCNCGKKEKPLAYNDCQWLMLDTTDNHTKNVDSLLVLVKKYQHARNAQRQMGVLSELGHVFRESSRYRHAMRAHQQQLAIARKLSDTLMIASALNDLGVNSRRMGLYYEGMLYHSQAAEASAGTHSSKRRKLMKCEAIAYNGLGNVYISTGNYKKADDMLRRALMIERKLGSHLGMDIGNANIGEVFEKRGMFDSALVYYDRAYQHSIKAGSNVGVAYYHMNVGRVYQQQKQYDKSIAHLEKAMNITNKDGDLWLWLQPCISLAGMYVEMNERAQADEYLTMALNTARQIEAKEFYPDIYRMRSDYFKKAGDYRRALEYYILSEQAEDSIMNKRNFFEIENLQDEIVNRQNALRIKDAQVSLSKQRMTNYLLLAGILVLIIISATLWYVGHLRSMANRRHKDFAKMRDNFFTNITHELRTPLTLIMGYGEEVSMASEGQMAEMRRIGDMIVRQGKSMLSLVNKLLDISKMRAKVTDPVWQHGDIVPYMRAIVEGGQVLTKPKNITMHFMPRQNEIYVDIVPDYMRKIMRNLIVNAIKFTGTYGTVNIGCYQENEMFVLTVSDNGIGMDREVVRHIFEPFYQGGGDSSNIGTGVGLSLVYQMVKAMDGRISVNSEKGKGTIFIVELPIRHGNKSFEPFTESALDMVDADDNLREPATKNERETQRVGGHCAKILVVEDNTDVATFIGHRLSGDYQVVYAANGSDGFAKATDLLPDLIVTDLMMPGMDGMELCRKLRATSQTSTIPIIIVTAKATQEDLEEGLKAGANAYLFKPFSSNELRIRIAWILTERRMLSEKFALANIAVNELDGKLSTADMEFISRFTNFVYNDMRSTNIDHAELANKLNMSMSTLRRKISDISGESLSNYITRIRINYACQRLKSHPEESVSAVGLCCGFSDNAYFSRQFKQIAGVSPSQYRKNVDAQVKA